MFQPQYLLEDEYIIKIFPEISWDKRAELYDNLSWVDRDELMGSIIGIIKNFRHNTIIDLGTGTGKVLNAIKRYFVNAECWGVDYCDKMLQKVKNKDDFILINNNIENMIDIPSNYFDIVVARMVFHHIDDLKAAQREILRILKNGGVFILCEGTPPDIKTIPWYSEMFSYKEKRHTFTEIDLINIMISMNLKNITTKTVVLKNCSLNNWLKNSGLPTKKIQIIKDMHIKAPDYVKKAYNMKFIKNDCLMQWKFATVYGIK